MVPSAYMANKALTTTPLSRRDETARRVRLLNGTYFQDLRSTAERLLGKVRLKGIGQLSSVRNPLDQFSTSHAVQHNTPAFVTGLDDGLLALIGDYTSPVTKDIYAEAGGKPMPSKMSSVCHAAQRIWIAANECAVFVEIGATKLILRHVDPSVLEGEQAQDDPGQPIILRWERRRKVDGDWQTTVDEWDVSDPKNPSYRVLDTALLGSDGDYNKPDDLTEKLFGKSQSGEGYSWRWTQGDRKGTPYIPARIYHKVLSPDLWTPYRGIEIVDGTLVAGVMWSFWVHCVLDASWPQRYSVNATPIGAIANKDGTKAVVTDPATLLMLEAIVKDQPVVIGQFEPGADPEALGRSIDNFCVQLEASIVAVDLSSTGGDPLEQISRAREKTIAGYDSICREGDGAVLEICAAIANNWKNKAYPEAGYGLLYRDDINSVLTTRSDGEE